MLAYQFKGFEELVHTQIDTSTCDNPYFHTSSHTNSIENVFLSSSQELCSTASCCFPNRIYLSSPRIFIQSTVLRGIIFALRSSGRGLFFKWSRFKGPRATETECHNASTSHQEPQIYKGLRPMPFLSLIVSGIFIRYIFIDENQIPPLSTPAQHCTRRLVHENSNHVALVSSSQTAC